MTGPTDWQDVAHVLCVRLDAMGDVLMTEPAIRAIKDSNRNRRVTLLTSQSGAEAAKLIPSINEVIVYDAPWMKASEARNESRDFELISKLRTMSLDAAFIFTVYSQSPLPAALSAYLAGIPLRTAHCRENPYQLLTHWLSDPEPTKFVRHEVERQLELVKAAGFVSLDDRIRLSVPSQARGAVGARLQRCGLDFLDPWLIVHPGSRAISRQYPARYFAAALRTLSIRHGFQAVFTGDESEKPLVEAIREAMKWPSISLCGQLSIEELAAAIQEAPLLLSNNTGPVHLAAGTGTPVVDLYALTNPQHMPWQIPSRVLYHDVSCRFCYKSICPEGHHHCLTLVAPSEVVEAVVDLYWRTKETRAYVHTGIERRVS